MILNKPVIRVKEVKINNIESKIIFKEKICFLMKSYIIVVIICCYGFLKTY